MPTCSPWAARIVAEGLADEILRLWLATPFEGGRHERRVEADRRDRTRGVDDEPVHAACRPPIPSSPTIVRRELERQNTTIQLIASENFTSPAVLAAQGSVLTNKYSEGYPGKRYYGGNDVVDDAEELARDRAARCSAPTTPTCSRTRAPTPTWPRTSRCSSPGDKVMGMRLDQGGHLTHGSPVNFSGRLYDFVAYGVDDETETLDYDEVARPRAGASGRS